MRIIAKACGAWIVWGCLALQAAAQQGIPWQSDLETAKQAAAGSRRLVLMHFSASWCHWCKPLETNVFGQPQVAQAIDANYVAVRMDYDQHRQIAKQYGVKGVPWDVVITPDGQLVEDFNSPQTADGYASRVTKIASRELAKSNAQYASQQPQAQPAGPVAGAPMGYGNPADAYARPQEAPRQPAPTDRYADYYNRQQQAPRVDPVNPPYTGQVSPVAGPAQPPVWAGRDLASAQGAQNAAPPANNQPVLNAPFIAPGAPGIATSPVPVAQPMFAMDSHCPVHLLEQAAWVAGDRAWGATHRGKTYLFVSKECQAKFMADADRYAPALSGNDPVALVDRGQTVAGRREHGCYFGVEPNRRIVLFADEASYQAFSRNPQRYAGQILAPQSQ